MCTELTETSGSGISCSLWSVFRSQIWITPLWSPTINSAWKNKTKKQNVHHLKYTDTNTIIKIYMINYIISEWLTWLGCRHTQLIGALTWKILWHCRFLDLNKKDISRTHSLSNTLWGQRSLTSGPRCEPYSPLLLCTSSGRPHGNPQTWCSYWLHRSWSQGLDCWSSGRTCGYADILRSRA